MSTACPSGKRTYSSHALAKLALKRIRYGPGAQVPGQKPSRCYKCRCGGWHLTRQRPKHGG